MYGLIGYSQAEHYRLMFSCVTLFAVCKFNFRILKYTNTELNTCRDPKLYCIIYPGLQVTESTTRTESTK